MKLIYNDKEIKIKECRSFISRLKGFMFNDNIDHALLFNHCNSIHTFFMITNIDVIMTDKENNVLFIFENVKPWKVILPKKNVFNVYELPSGSISGNVKKVRVFEWKI